jgi:enoyl-CoA hydratase
LNYRTLVLQSKGSIGLVTFSRPQVLNALNMEMCDEIVDVCTEINKNQDIKAAIFTGSGRAFISGADISEMQAKSPIEALTFLKHVIAATRAIEQVDVPSIGAINGFAFGGGNEISMSFDIRIASENAKFAQQEINLGIGPGGGATQRLPRLVGYGRAMEIILTGDVIDAQEAYRIGLVNRVTRPNLLMDDCYTLANQLALKSKAAVIQTKAALRASRSVDFEHGLDFEIECDSLLWSTPEQKELMQMFLKRRSGANK